MPAENLWIREFPASVTVCDPQGIILEMNERAAETFAADGGFSLVGTNLLDCHPASARAKLEELMANRRQNVYTIEKKGVHKLVFQSPWFQNGDYAGFIEIVFVIPVELPHHVRG
jgi:transcriptional regulator with PAS, ATPase and Fis domain